MQPHPHELEGSAALESGDHRISATVEGFTHVLEDRAYTLRRFLTPLHHGDVHRDVMQALYRPRPVRCRCGAAIRSTKRYQARVKARAKARMRMILRELERRLPPS